MNWAGVARELGTTVNRVKKKWRKLQNNDNTGAVSEPHASGSHAKIPYAKLPSSYAKRFTNPNLDNSDLLEYFNTRWKDPNPTSTELARFVNVHRSLDKVLKWFCAARAKSRRLQNESEAAAVRALSSLAGASAGTGTGVLRGYPCSNEPIFRRGRGGGGTYCI